MSFIFSTSLDTDLALLRSRVGDTEEGSYVMSDAELNYFLTQYGSVEDAVLKVMDSIIQKLSLNSFDLETGQEKDKLSQRIKTYKELLNHERYKFFGRNCQNWE